METHSTYYDHSQNPVRLWFWQAFFCSRISYYYSKRKQCYCRQIDRVEGRIINTWFVPYLNWYVNYKQATIHTKFINGICCS